MQLQLGASAAATSEGALPCRTVSPASALDSILSRRFPGQAAGASAIIASASRTFHGVAGGTPPGASRPREPAVFRGPQFSNTAFIGSSSAEPPRKPAMTDILRLAHSLSAEQFASIIKNGPASPFWPPALSAEGAHDLLCLSNQQPAGRAALSAHTMPATSGEAMASLQLQLASDASRCLILEESNALLRQRLADLNGLLPPRTQHSTDIKSLHKPPQFGDDIKRRSAADLRAHIDTVLAYMDRTGADFHSDIMFWFSWQHMAWIQNLLLSRPMLTRAEFSGELVNYCTGQVRAADVLALESLIKGHVTQGSSSAAQYAQRFLNVARLLPKESQLSMCKHYISGLTPVLRARACLARDNQEWTDLTLCIQYSYAEEYRLSFETPYAPSRDQGEFPPPPKRQNTGEQT